MTEASLADAGGKSFIVLPSGLIQPSKQRNFWEQLCPNLNLSDTMIERVMPHLDDDLPTEAYVTVIVQQSDIQSDPLRAALRDRYDHPLLQLKETALQQHGRIVAFVHQGTHYHFADGQLIKQG